MFAQTISKYKIERIIGSGSYGTVVQATDPVLNRTVALKILRQADAPADGLKTHIREARALARLQHPNIVGIFGLEQEGDQTYLAMEHVEGETLAARLAQGPLPLDQALDIAAQLADALAAAHGQGVVHADIKPANVILDQRSHPRLVDFGLARLSGIARAQDTLAATMERGTACAAPSAIWRPSCSWAPSRTPCPISSPSAPWCSRCWAAAAPSTRPARAPSCSAS
ncbi:serine/threonine-protein kinase [Nitrospirillum sp. BR 11828]|uniref:serine/threonine-protein kinase n=1 Tax=Nitrospirillum sp. BR 11828 TaxID=3104325 RepID=UPI002ACAB49A|nr:serine/threonine-protein kinase [Nitrospirillum sp. BR 11828]MDZ5648602.1 serine/threonine-protein kinase [Nitrospirillum sp. BR 11828]